MHHSAMLNGRRFFETYLANITEPVIVDVGAQDVNGSLRAVAPERNKYIGVDFVSGRGVDIVLEDPYHIPLRDNFADAVVSNSTFEHSEMFWLLFEECLRITKPNGLVYINVPSNGVVHRYPVDCWRFYPDAGLALSHWAKRIGHKTLMLECFTSKQDKDQWNDFVSVYIKDCTFKDFYAERIIHSYTEFLNGRIDEGEILNSSDLTEDLHTINRIYELAKPKFL